MPQIEIPHKLEKILTTKARIIVIIGGRSSAKSETVGRVLLMKCQTEGADVLCGREFQNSIEDSVHKLLKNLIEKIPAPGFHTTDKKIDCDTGGNFRFRGFARNPDNIKSSQEFKYSWVEEAQSLSQESIDILLPTIIRNPGAKVFFTANPMSAADPFSKEFILPFLYDLQHKGYYEDDLYLVIKVNWRDNPWHGELEVLRQKHYQTMPRAKYNWIWEGDFNDNVEDALISAEWFDACIDAHKHLGFEPVGIRMSSHDPADQGEDAKAFAFRHGSVLLDLQERHTGDINDSGDWATGLAIQWNSDAFIWDCDGLGIGLKRQVARAFEGKGTRITMFKGSEAVDNPEAVFDPVTHPIQGQKTIKDALRNKRAQYYYELRNRIYRTWQAVDQGVYQDPEKLISFDSSIGLLSKLRSELCRMPIKPNSNGLLDLYTKQEMKAKFKFPSPNLADCCMMLCKMPPQLMSVENITRPRPIKPMGKRAAVGGRYGY